MTLTAPSFGAVHTTGTKSVRCRPRSNRPRCRHGKRAWCDESHQQGDERLGEPLCTECFDHEGAVLWNATASQLWDRTMIRLRRQLAAAAGLTTTELGRAAQIHYLKVAELQRRGLVHFHVLLRADGTDGPESEPPGWLSTELLAATFTSVVASTQVRGLVGVARGWGSQVDVANLSSEQGDDRRVASYLSKYATKTTDGTLAFARQFAHRREIERADGPPHLVDLALTAWRLGGRKDLRALRLSQHAHTLGYRGQLITKSRCFSTTFTSLRDARVEFRSKESHEDPIEGSFSYDGRGYDDPDSTRLTELFHEMGQDLRRHAKRSQATTSYPVLA